MGREMAACLGLWVPGSFQRAAEAGPGAVSPPVLPEKAPQWLRPGPELGKVKAWGGRRVLQESSRVPGSVISHNREGSELAQFSLILPFPLLIGVARLVQLLAQVSEDLVHFRVVDHLGGRRGWSVGSRLPAPQHCPLWAGFCWSLPRCPPPQHISLNCVETRKERTTACSSLGQSTAWGGSKSTGKGSNRSLGGRGWRWELCLLSKQRSGACVCWAVAGQYAPR